MQNKLSGFNALNPSSMEEGRTRVDSSMGGASEGGGALSEYFTEVGSINNDLARLRECIRVVGESHTKVLSSISHDESQGAAARVDSKMKEASRIITSIKGRLEKMAKDVQKRKETSPNDPDTRMAASMHGTLSQKLLEAVEEYNQIQEANRSRYREKVERQVKIVNPNATSEQVDDMIRGGGNVFEQEMLRTGQAQMREAYLEAEEKTKDLHKIEAQLIELRQLFMDLHTLVAAQGEVLDTIESNVSKSVEYTSKGVTELIKANNYQKSSRKKMCCIAIVLLVVFLVILIVVVGIKAR